MTFAQLLEENPMSIITIEQFMSEPSAPDEEDLEPEAPVDPLTSIAHSLKQLVVVLAQGVPSAAAAEDEPLTASQEEKYIARARELEAKQALIEQVLAVVKPSVSKLADQVREVLGAGVVVVVEEPAPSELQVAPELGVVPDTHEIGATVGVPTDDATVEEWRAFARTMTGAPEGTVVDQMNRSQIRTMLGIAHPAAEGDE